MGKRGNRQRTGGGGGRTDTRAGFRAPTAGHEDVKFVFGKPTSTADCEDAMTTLCRYLATMTVPGMTEYATHLEAREEPTFEDPPEPSRKEATVKADGTKGEPKELEPDLYKMRLSLYVEAVKQVNK